MRWSRLFGRPIRFAGLGVSEFGRLDVWTGDGGRGSAPHPAIFLEKIEKI